MKSILISIKPEWVANILNGYKTIEIRKTAPKCDLPIDVYIYCTKGSPTLMTRMPEDDYVLNGKVVAKFTLRKVEKIRDQGFWYETDSMKRDELILKGCLNLAKLHTYLTKCETTRHENNIASVSITFGGGYAWHISDLVKFDKPKELDEFDYPNPSGTRYVSNRSINGLPSKKHPPQSWCYVEEKE